MSGKVIDLDAQRPHLIISTDDAEHVYPIAFFLDFAAGKSFGREGLERPTDDVMRQIVTEWLRCLHEHGGFADEEEADG